MGSLVDDDLAHCGVQRGKELVLREDLALGQQVHQRGLAHVGISHQCHADEPSAVLALGAFLFVYLCQALFQQGHAVQDDASVHLQLRLTRSTQTHRAFPTAGARAASLSFEVRPQALQAGQHVLVLRQLYLRLGVGRLCPHGEDVEDERRAVQYLHLQCTFDIAYLLGGQLVVEDDHAHFAFRFLLLLDVCLYLVQLSLAHVGH